MPSAPALPRPRRDVRSAGSTAGLLWFAAMVGGWLCFGALLLFSEPTLDALWQRIRELPLLVEALVWFAAFPFVLALGIWESSWEAWLRLGLVACCAVGWSIAFWPGTWTRQRD